MEEKFVENKIAVKTVMGIDLSLTGAGISFLKKEDKSIIYQELISTKKKTTKKNKDQTQLALYDGNMNLISEDFISSSVLVDMPRLVFIRNRIKELILKYKPEMIIIEGYAMAGVGRGVSGLLEIGGIIRMTIFDLNIPYIQVPPPNAKAYISGLATAKKDMIISSIHERFNVFIENDNIADSYCLAMMYVEFGDDVHQYLVQGGVDKLKELKVQEIRSFNNKIISFKKLLFIGHLERSDFLNAYNQINDKDLTVVSGILGIKTEEIEKLLNDKPGIHKINDTYRYKKPAKKKKEKKIKLT